MLRSVPECQLISIMKHGSIVNKKLEAVTPRVFQSTIYTAEHFVQKKFGSINDSY